MKSFISFIVSILRSIFGVKEPVDIPIPTPPVPIPPAPQPIPVKPNREILYEFARTQIGKDASPSDLADDTVGCAESVTNVLKYAGFWETIILSTWSLWRALETDLRYEEVFEPLPGDVIVYATDTGTGKIKHGHTGVVSFDGFVMSNNSNTGLWDEHLTLTSMKAYYEDLGGFPKHLFRVK